MLLGPSTAKLTLRLMTLLILHLALLLHRLLVHVKQTHSLESSVELDITTDYITNALSALIGNAGLTAYLRSYWRLIELRNSLVH